MPFVRVRSARVGDPLHEFDVAAPEVGKHPELYEVLDPVPSPLPRAAVYVAGVKKAPKKVSRSAKKRAGRSGENNTTAPAGADS